MTDYAEWLESAQSWNFEDVRPVIPGPWQDEPDKVQWIDPATDLDCLTVRNRYGVWCGYVGVPPDHPLHGIQYDDAPHLSVHGDLTFSSLCHEGGRICHVPLPGRPDAVWWFGFDCGHLYDYSPNMPELPGISRDPDVRGETYRDLDYVRQECARLAGQLVAEGLLT